MGNSEGKKTQPQGAKPADAERNEEWKNKNGPVVIVAVAVLLIAAMAAAMKMCG